MGTDYGYEIVVTGLLDTLSGNLICADSQQQMCMEPETWEMVFHVVEKRSVESARVFKPAMMVRAGVPFDEPLIEAYFAADQSGLSEPRNLHNVPEDNDYIYNTTKDGEPIMSRVAICNVFTCNVWKAGGLLSPHFDDINCGELRVGDNYRLKVYDEDFQRPQVDI